MGLRKPWSGGGGLRDYSRHSDATKIYFADTDGPIVLWPENEILRISWVDGKVPEIPG